MSDTRHEQLTRWHVDMFPWLPRDIYVQLWRHHSQSQFKLAFGTVATWRVEASVVIEDNWIGTWSYRLLVAGVDP